MDAWRALPGWLAFLLAVAAGVAVGWAGGRLLASGASRLFRRWRLPPPPTSRLRLPVGLWLGTSLTALLLGAAKLPWIEEALSAKLVLPLLVVWGCLLLVDLAWEGFGRRQARAHPGLGALLLLLRRTGKVLVVGLGLAFVLQKLGLPLSGLFVASGVFGAAVAFAARSPVENLFAFVNLTVDPPFVLGDEIRVVHVRGGPSTVGRVQRIGLQSTVIQVRGRSLVSVPNALLSGAMWVENLSARDRRRVRLSLSLPEALSAAALEKLCLGVEAAMESLPQRASGHQARVWLSGGSGEPRLEVQVWLKSPERDGRRSAEQRAVLALRAELEQPGAGRRHHVRGEPEPA